MQLSLSRRLSICLSRGVYHGIRKRQGQGADTIFLIWIQFNRTLARKQSAAFLGSLSSALILSFPPVDFFLWDAEHFLDGLLKSAKRITGLFLERLLWSWHDLHYTTSMFMVAPE